MDRRNKVFEFLQSQGIEYSFLEHPSLSFHPNDNRATVVISQEEFARYLKAVGNSCEYIKLW